MANTNTMNATEAEEVPDGASASASADEGLFDTLKQASQTARNGARDVIHLAGAEWRLSLRALTLALLSLTCLAMLLVVLWLSAIGGVAYWAYDSDIHPLSIWLGLILAHVGMVYWLWKQVRKLLQLVGFRQTLQTLVSSILDRSEDEDSE